MKTTTNIIYSALALFVLACFAISLQAQTCQKGCLSNENTAFGDDALISDTTGFSNTAIGEVALEFNTTGTGNTAIGGGALGSNTTANNNTATGSLALISNTTGTENTGTGQAALGGNTTGIDNTANGFEALISNTTGNNNTATGSSALFNNTTGIDNTANGFEALFSNTDGSENTGIGLGALAHNTTGKNNTAIGDRALLFNTNGSSNIALGYQAGANLTRGGDNNIDIGNRGVAGEANTIRVGTTGTQTNTYAAGISGATVPTGVAVIIDTDGHLGTTTSSARFKEGIKPMDKASEAILSLKPVTFHYKHELDPQGTPQFGLVAEDVEKVNPDLVARDEQGKPYTVRYEAVNAMLLNEFLKEHRTVQELKSAGAKQEATIAEFKKEIANLTTTVKEQASQIQKVSAQLAVSKPAPQTLANNQ